MMNRHERHRQHHYRRRVVFIIGGATGGMTLRGTRSSSGLIAVGVLLVGIGLFRLTRNR
jgi:hypothetical protein